LQTKSPSLWPIRGQAQPFISLGDVRLVEILLPPIAEQQRIVDVVSSVDAYIDALQQQVDAARTARNAVLHELLSIGGNDWAETTLGEVAETRLGKMLSATSNLDVGSLLPYLRNANVRWGKIDLSDLNEMFFSEREIEILSLKEGDVLICEGGEPGRSAYLDRDLPGVLFQKAVHRVRCTSVLRPKYLVYWMEFQTRNSKIEDFLTSTTIAHLTGEKLRQLPIFLPSLIEQDGTVTVVESFDQLIDQGEETLNRAKSLRSGLLSDLLSGEHEIPVSYDIFLEAA
jgi:type I restriction enzyme S subunit